MFNLSFQYVAGRARVAITDTEGVLMHACVADTMTEACSVAEEWCKAWHKNATTPKQADAATPE